MFSGLTRMCYKGSLWNFLSVFTVSYSLIDILNIIQIFKAIKAVSDPESEGAHLSGISAIILESKMRIEFLNSTPKILC